MLVRLASTRSLFRAAASWRGGVLILGLIMGPFFWTGCVDPPSNYGPVQADVVVQDENEFDDLWETILRVLRRVSLQPDRQDRREGVITTLPITTQQWFEFWRHDAMGPYQFLESSMHTIQRQATIRIHRGEANRYRVSVRIDVFRFSTPERQVTTPSGAYGMYSEKRPTEAGEMAKQAGSAAHWVLLGRDPRMEGVLLRRILVHYPGAYELIEEPEGWGEESPTTAPTSESQPAAGTQ